MSLKELLTNSYGADTYKRTNQLKLEKNKKAKLKNQIIFLQRCITHKIIPKSMRVRYPVTSRRGKNVTDKYRFNILLCAKNDTKSRFFQTLKRINNLKESLSNELSPEHIRIVKSVKEKSDSKTFLHWKEHLKKKFEKLSTIELRNTTNINTRTLKPVLKMTKPPKNNLTNNQRKKL